jgi:hypothetical protein
MMRKCLGCDAASLDKWFPVFLCKLGTAGLATQHHILDDLICSNSAVRASDFANNIVFILCPIVIP